MIKPDEYQYFWETLDGHNSGGPYRTIGALKSALQTSSYRGRYTKDDYKAHAEEGVNVYKAKISFDLEFVELWRKG